MTRDELKSIGLRMVDLEALTGRSHAQVWRWFQPGVGLAECAINVIALWRASPEWERKRILDEARARLAIRRKKRTAEAS